MANTLIPIQTYTLASATSSVTFSNIPQNYTDLKLVVSARNTSNSNNTVQLFLNSDTTASNYTIRRIYADGTTLDGATFNAPYVFYVPTPSSTASTFSNTEINISNYTSSVAKSFSAEGTAETNASTGHTLIILAGRWTGTSAVTSISLTAYAGTFDVASTFTLYGISNGVKATGGTITVAGGYAYHTFTSTGSFLPNQQIKGAEFLVIAGGGGGSGTRAGGGGAGGLLNPVAQTLNAGNSYTALIGAGGSGGASGATGVAGSSSVFTNYVSIGGGRGGGAGFAATSGGSGGGGGEGGSGVAGTGTSGQGNSGSNAASGLSTTGGAGGGAGAVGGTAVALVAGTGGIGLAFNTWGAVTGTGQLSGGNYYYAGGGGGGIDDYNRIGTVTAGTGGLGGGGNGQLSVVTAGTAGTANTGGGGGGGGGRINSADGTGQAGGSGLIIVRYPLA